jgi:sialic acid synthase
VTSVTRYLNVGERRIADDTPAFVIAEIGHNHQGDLDLCIEMIRSAARCGADAVKLQKRSNKDQFTEKAYNEVYNSTNSFGPTYGEHREHLEFGANDYRQLQRLADELGVIFFATAFDIPSFDFLAELGAPVVKIASGDIVNTPLLEHASASSIPLIASTGAASMGEVERAYETLKRGKSDFAILQCTSGYPAAHEELNIRVLESYRRRFPDTVVGFSSHENGIAMPLVAFALGARIIEKHFTLDRSMKGTDQAFSLSPSGLSRMCRDLKRAAAAIGDGEKVVYESEFGPMKKQRKSIVAARDLASGTVISLADLAYKVPDHGLKPYERGALVGRKLTRSFLQDDYITLDGVE